MKESIRLELLTRKPTFAKGHACIEMFDPLTLKVKERIEGDNHVFSESLLAGNGGDWQDRINNCNMVLSDTSYPIDAKIPYILGQQVGYGSPSLGTLGLLRGAYNSANQILAQKTLEKVRWKFQYDFTTPQANVGTITQIGLTSQFRAGALLKMTSGYALPPSTIYSRTCDGRYYYDMSSAGIITKVDTYTGVSTNIDVSTIVGIVSGDNKCVAYNPYNKKYMVVKYSATSANRACYLFSDSSFSTLEATYSLSANAHNFGGNNGVFFYGNYLFGFSSSQIAKVDFISNTAVAYTDIGTTSAIYSNLVFNENPACGKVGGCVGNTPIGDKLIASGFGRYDSSNYYKAIIFNLEAGVVVGYAIPISNSYATTSLYPITEENIVCATVGAGYVNGAIAVYQLPTPITKTSAYGMTATYELEVFW